MNEEVVNGEQTQDPEAQRILDNIADGKEPFEEADVDEQELPSDSEDVSEDNDEDGETLYAGKYKSIEELKKGIKNIGSDLDDDIIDGMSDEALEKYYQKLNKAKSSKPTEEKKNKYSLDNKEDTEDTKPEEAKNISNELWQELDATFAEKGGITDEQYDKLAKLGIPNAVVDSYLDGIVAKQAQQTQAIYDAVGGEEVAKELKAWADNNLDSDEIDYINTLSGKALIGAIKGVKARYDLENGTKRVVGSKTASRGGSYKSLDEYMKDVSDKRYNTDELFRSAVEKKLSRSKL